MRRIATFTCEDCNQPTRRRVQTGRPMVCLECGLQRGVDNARQLATKSGPAWERWLAATSAPGDGTGPSERTG